MTLRDILDDKLLPLLHTVLADSRRHAAALTFDKRYAQHLGLISLYCTIIDLAHGEEALIDKGQTAAVPVILRSILEAYADLRALIDDRAYAKRMHATWLKEKARNLKNAISTPDNPFFAGMRSGMQLEQGVDALQREIDDLRQQGHPPLNNQDRFDAAGLKHEYQAIYWLLCLEGHNNISALEDRHIEKHGDEYEVVLFKEADPKDLVHAVDALVHILNDSGVRVHKLLESEVAKHFETHQSALGGCRAFVEAHMRESKPSPS